MSTYRPRRFRYKVGQKATIPVKNKRYMNSIMTYFLKKEITEKTKCKKYNASRNYMMCLLGFNTAFRAEDLLQLKVNDVINGYVNIREFKKKKHQIFPLNNALRREIENYVTKWGLTPYDYLFAKSPGYHLPLTRQRGDDILEGVARAVDLKQPFSMHSLRKTYAYQKYIETHDIFLVQRLLNHDDPTTTMIYICINTTEAEKEREKTYYSGLSKSP